MKTITIIGMMAIWLCYVTLTTLAMKWFIYEIKKSADGFEGFVSFMAVLILWIIIPICLIVGQIYPLLEVTK